jgi:menaquinone-dependent protoporphyrinogen oxidase
VKPILIIYATREGQTRHIADYIARKISEHGQSLELMNAASIPRGFTIAKYSAAIVGASLHGGTHEPEIRRFVKQHVDALNQIPTAFLSVSLAEVTVENVNAPPEKRAGAQADVKRTTQLFMDQTGWRPSRTIPVAGALMFSRYSFLTRFIMRRVARKEAGIVDTSRDYEFTDWTKLDAFVEEWVAQTVQTV